MKVGHMTNDNKSNDVSKFTGCGLLLIVGLFALAFGLGAAVVYVLVMIGSWIGGQ